MVLLDTRTAPEDLRDPELVDCTFRMVYFPPTGDGRGLGPVIGFFWQTFELACRWKTQSTKYSICIAERPRRLNWSHFQGGRDWLCNTGMQARGS